MCPGMEARQGRDAALADCSLSQKDLQEKFRANSCRTLSCHAIERLIEIVENLEDLEDCSVLTTLLKETSPPKIASKSI